MAILEKLVRYNIVTKTIIGCCFDVINELGSGFLESVYKKALLVVLQEKGLKYQEEVHFDIYFHGKKVGHYIADILVEGDVIVELKSCKSLTGEHQAQVINYLRATNLNVGLLINFGNSRLEYKRLHR